MIMIDNSNTLIIDDFWKGLQEYSPLFKYLENTGEVYIVGGIIRDLYNRAKYRDVDFIFNHEKFEDILNMFSIPFSKNSFNGYKFVIANITFDAWHIDQNWAFKNNLLKNMITNIQYGAFFNIDSLVYFVNKNLLFTTIYNNCISGNKLDIIIKNKDYIKLNPTYELNVIKSLFYKHIHNFYFSDSVFRYVVFWFQNEFDFEKIEYMQMKHFKKRVISSKIIEEWQFIAEKEDNISYDQIITLCV